MLAVVWVGKDADTSEKLTGAGSALPIWSSLISSASKQPLILDISPSIRYHWVDLNTGSLLNENCYNAIKLPFINGSQPQRKIDCSY